MKHLSKEYYRYIHSVEWSIKRREALLYHGNKCKSCGTLEKLDVHHLTYERFKNELMKDLTILCRSCHNLTHAKLDDVKNWRPKPHKFKPNGNKKVKSKISKRIKLMELRRKSGYPMPYPSRFFFS